MPSRNKHRPPVCRNFQRQGFCRYGDDCAFWHPGQSDLRTRIQGRQVTVESEPRHRGAAARKGNSSHSRWQERVRSHLIQMGGIDSVKHVATSVPLPPGMKQQMSYTPWLGKMGFIIVDSGAASRSDCSKATVASAQRQTRSRTGRRSAAATSRARSARCTPPTTRPLTRCRHMVR